MRLLSFADGTRQSYGVLTDDGVVDCGPFQGSKYPDLRSVLEAGALREVAEWASGEAPLAELASLTLLPVIPNPAKILCIGLNYDLHRLETGREKMPYPTVFTRFADTQVGHGRPLIVPAASDALDFEGELAVVIGKPARAVSTADAMGCVAGYSCYNDASVRDFQRHTTQFTPGKNFPGTGGFGPCLVTTEEIDDVHDLAIRTTLNGQTMQDASTSQLIFTIPELVAYLSTFTLLSPGDVIATGTPAGVGFKRQPPVFLKPGDEFLVEIEGVGTLRNTVEAET